jgi:hypothetical protein
MTNQVIGEEWVKDFENAYVECALWASYDTDEDGETFQLDEYDLSEEAEEQLRADAREFIDDQGEAMASLDPGQCGHDYWLSRNGHGAGFWDRGYGELGERLHKATKPYGGSDLYLGDDGLVHVS